MEKKCDELSGRKYNHIEVQFIAGYKLFLERLRYYDEAKHQMSINVWIVQPLTTYYSAPAFQMLNVKGTERLLNYVLQCVRRSYLGPSWTDLDTIVEPPRQADLPEAARLKARGLRSGAVLPTAGEACKSLPVPVGIKP